MGEVAAYAAGEGKGQGQVKKPSQSAFADSSPGGRAFDFAQLLYRSFYDSFKTR